MSLQIIHINNIWKNRIWHSITNNGWLVFFFLGFITFVGYLTPNPFLCKTIQFSMSTQFNCQKKILFQTIQAVIYNNSA